MLWDCFYHTSIVMELHSMALMDVIPNIPSSDINGLIRFRTHSNSFIHITSFMGDAKAANVLVDVNEDTNVTDFGGGCTKG